MSSAIDAASNPVGDISVATIDRHFELDDEDLLAEQLHSEMDIENAVVPSLTVSNTIALDPEEEILTAPTGSVLKWSKARCFISLFYSADTTIYCQKCKPATGSLRLPASCFMHAVHKNSASHCFT